MPDEAIVMDLNLGLKETSFKDLLSLVPVVYMTDFEDVGGTSNRTMKMEIGTGETILKVSGKGIRKIQWNSNRS